VKSVHLVGFIIIIIIIIINIIIITMHGHMESRNRPGVAQRVPGGTGIQIP